MLAVIDHGLTTLGSAAYCCSEGGSASSSPWVIVGVVVFAVLLAAWVFRLLVDDSPGAGESDEGEDGGGRGGGGRGPKRPRPEDPEPTHGDPEWWAEFERQFAAYVELTALEVPSRERRRRVGREVAGSVGGTARASSYADRTSPATRGHANFSAR